MAITFPRELPDVGYVTADFVLDDPVRASPSGGRQRRAPGDKFFEHAGRAGRVEVLWGTTKSKG